MMSRPGAGAKLGGTIARGAGWAILGAGICVAVILASLFQWIFPQGVVGYAVGGVVGLVAFVMSLGLLKGGGHLRATGVRAERDASVRALQGLARSLGGRFRVDEAAAILGCSSAEADGLLTALVREHSDEWSIDIDESGAVVYGHRGSIDNTRNRIYLGDESSCANQSVTQNVQEEHVDDGRSIGVRRAP